jgi:hypothetical protein
MCLLVDKFISVQQFIKVGTVFRKLSYCAFGW